MQFTHALNKSLRSQSKFNFMNGVNVWCFFKLFKAFLRTLHCERNQKLPMWPQTRWH